MTIDVPLDIYRDGPPAIIIVGRNGAGKSSLVNSIFASNLAEVGTRSDVTLGVVKYTLPNSGVIIYDTPGACGLDEEADKSIRNFLQLNISTENYKLISADMIIYLFTYERLSKQEFDFFREIDMVYKNRIVVVKNYKSNESKKDFEKNIKDIQTRIGRVPICVDALNGNNIEELIREIFRFLTPDKLSKFNMSLETRKQRARELSKIYTLKAASNVAVIKRETQREMKTVVEEIKNQLTKQIINSYIEQASTDENILELTKNNPSYGVIIEKINERGLSAILGGGLGALIGILGGPGGLIIGGILGMLFGASAVKNISKGGSPAVINVIAQGYGLSEIIEDSLKDPIMIITQSEKQMKNWLKDNKRKILGTLEEATTRAEYAIKEAALIEYLDNPNTTDPAMIELKLRPIIDTVYK